MTKSDDEFGWIPDSAIAEADEDHFQDEFDFDFFSCVLRRNAYHLDALRRQVELLARRGDHDAALELDCRLLEMRPDDCIVRYNYACSLAMTGTFDLALEELEWALRFGYQDWEHIRLDSDLDPLRGQQGFRELVLRYEYFGDFQG